MAPYVSGKRRPLTPPVMLRLAYAAHASLGRHEWLMTVGPTITLPPFPWLARADETIARADARIRELRKCR